MTTTFAPAPITWDMISKSDTYEFYSDASDLGWPPGAAWPRTVETTTGNGQPFLLWSASRDCALYRQSLGCIVLRVFND